MVTKTFRDLEMDKPDQIRQRCRFWLFGGKCGLTDTPPPTKSRCIGTKACDSWEWKNPRGF